ncbi:MAG: benzoyl-CoA-dihydrodiol lyase, partial [Paracraurococcus sp.]
AVLPGTGGLTRITDKRRVRRDLADVFCSVEEGVRGRRAVEWRLVDEVVPPSAWEARVAERARDFAAQTDRPRDAKGVALPWLERVAEGDTIRWSSVAVELDRVGRRATITVAGPDAAPPASLEAAKDAAFWPLRMARELEDAILHLRTNEPELGLWALKTRGAAEAVLAYDAFLDAHAADWFIREVRLNLKRVLKRLDVTSRSLIALVEPGSCFAGTLAELAFAADRALMFSGDTPAPATIALSPLNFGAYPMGNGLTRLQARFWGAPDSLGVAQEKIGAPIAAENAESLGLVTIAYDETDWEDEVRILLEERASFSPDALTGMEANLRFVGPETMESRIFGRLTAWQNWIFQRPNSVGETGALKLYGTGIQPSFDRARV